MTTAQNLPTADMQVLASLVQLLLEERAEAAKEKKERAVIKQARDESDQKLSAYNEKEKRNIQRMCTHQKNQPSKHHHTPRALKTDYAVSYHVYPDGISKVRCLICGAQWFKGDTAEMFNGGPYKGKKNWTKIGWNEALKMVAESTNTPTKSELNMINAVGTVLAPGVAIDADELDD